MQLSWINPKAALKKSGINGLGLFAKKKIGKGEVVLAQGGRISTCNEIYKKRGPLTHVCFLIDVNLLICPFDKKEKSYKDGAFFMNHSCSANCGVKGQIVFVAMREIKQGEELTYDYAMTDCYVDDPNYKSEPMRCNCLSRNCRKFVCDSDWKNLDLIKRYNGFFSAHIKDMQEKHNLR